MNIEIIKKAVAGLPHVKTVWVEGNNVFIHEKKGAEKVELETIAAQPSEPVVPVTEPAAQPSEPVAKADTTSTNKKK
jgi:hypothetical protein